MNVYKVGLKTEGGKDKKYWDIEEYFNVVSSGADDAIRTAEEYAKSTYNGEKVANTTLLEVVFVMTIDAVSTNQ